jgi:Flp pilus assembly protein TadG
MRSARGAALVEFVVALPVLLAVLIGTIDLGRVFYMAMAVTNAARAGAQYGAHSVMRSGDTSGMEAAATAAAAHIGPVSAVAVRTCECAPDSGATFTTASCTGTCPSGQHLVIVVTVTTSRTFNTFARFPGIPHTLAVTRASRLRVVQ